MATATKTGSPQPNISLDELTERRRAVGLSQARMAMLAGVNPNVVSDIMRGRRTFTEATAQRLDAALRGYAARLLAEAEQVLRAS